jgi:mono/diheme cytochrome c family protein
MARRNRAPPIGLTAAGAALFCAAVAAGAELARTDAAVYASACASCHGADGKGRLPERVGFETPLPDFSDCSFATREPDADWYAVVHQGGPTRAFARMMPAFGAALSEAEMMGALRHVRSFCGDARWPRGDLNLPLALFTEKAFPEDELVLQTFLDAEGPSEGETQAIFEKRFGARGQLELVVPVAWADSADGLATGLGDVAVGWKQNMLADLETGSILSLGGEVILPTGDENRGLGKGTAVVEPFALFGQILPADSFFQAHLFAEFPVEDGFEDEVGWRAAVGRTFAVDDGFGRAWTPMVEVLGGRELASGAKTSWDIVPQLQVSLSRRQHVLAAVGARIPLTDADERDTQIVFYLLWDWYDGGFRDGWR